MANDDEKVTLAEVGGLLQEAVRLLQSAYGRVAHDPDCKKQRAQPIRKAITDCTCGTSDWFDRANVVLDKLDPILPQNQVAGGDVDAG